MVTFLAVGIFALAPGGAAAAASIRVLDQNYRIRFGDSIELTLEAASDGAEITSVQAFFRPQGTRTITTYSYPRFTRGQQITATFEIPTREPTYYPPGVVFEVHYLIRDAAGVEFETPPLQIEYLDPQFKWQRQSRNGLTIIYHDRPASAVQTLTNQVTDRIPRIESVIGKALDGDYRAVLFNSGAEARAAFPFISATTKEGHVFAGFAYADYSLFVLTNAETSGVVHELTHLIFGRATDTPAAKRPSWLNEGLAVYFETGSRDATASTLKPAIKGDRLLTLRAMNSLPGRPADINVFYPQAGNFAGYLIEVHGDERMRWFISALRGGALPNNAALETYGRTLEELENEWRRAIGAKPLEPLPSPTAIAAPAHVATAAPVAAGTSVPQSEGASPVPASTAGEPSNATSPLGREGRGDPDSPSPLEGEGRGDPDSPSPLEGEGRGEGNAPSSAILWWLLGGGGAIAAVLGLVWVSRHAFGARRARGGT
ncbi:MAG: hypothetical protein HY678_11030 [Chloroflexi bacterium]|nr:hypothetical protein [Chloroflexota bacterium]